MRILIEKNESHWAATRKSLLPFKAEQLYQGIRHHQTYSKSRRDSSGRSLHQFDQLKCIFIHIPKNGGLSISESLFSNSIIPGHRGIQFYQALYGASIREYFKFAICRNPWDRLVSAYHFLSRGGINETDAYLAEKHLTEFNSFDDFVCGWLTRENAYKIQHFVPQHEYVCGFRGRLAVDYVARLENLDEDFPIIAGKLNLPSASLTRTNQSDRSKDYKSYYTEESRGIVASVYAKDISLFHYSFD